MALVTDLDELRIRSILIKMILEGQSIMPDIFPKVDILTLNDGETQMLFNTAEYLINYMKCQMPDYFNITH